MVLVIDCGNTAISFASYQNKKRMDTFHILTDVTMSKDEYITKLKPIFFHFHLSTLEACLLSSVVPTLTPILQHVIAHLTGYEPKLFSKGFKTGLLIQIDHPSELGSDLVIDGVQAVSQYGYPCIIADLGTATKLVGIDAQGRLVGVSILPGFMIAYQALIGKASQLMDIALKRPSKILGKNTPDSISSGMIQGHELLLKSMFDAIEKELQHPCKKILTGGYAQFVYPGLKEEVIYDPHLNVDGLFTVYEKNKELF